MIFDNKIIELFQHIVRKDGYMELPADGYSMFPSIRKGDICRFVTCNPQLLEKGDIVLFYIESGQLIAHRFSHTVKFKNLNRYYFKGDTNLDFDQPVSEYQIIGKLDRIQRMNKVISLETPFYKKWGKFILSVPVISRVLKRYLSWSRLYHF